MKLLLLFTCALAVLASISFANRAIVIKGQIYRTDLNITQTYAVGASIPLSSVCPDYANPVADTCTGTTQSPPGYPGAPRAPSRSLVGKTCTATFTGYTATSTEAGFVYGPGVVIVAYQRCENITV